MKKLEVLKLRNFQHEGKKFLLPRKRAALTFEPGLGKTGISIRTVCAIRKMSKERITVLVFCPKVAIGNWEREIKRWCISRADSALYEDIDWTVINWDTLVDPKFRKNLYKLSWDIIIGDESHQAIKNTKCTRGKSFQRFVSKKTKRLYLLTATPASKSGADYFGMFKVLEPERFKNVDLQKWCEQFCKSKYSRFAFGGLKFYGFKNKKLLNRMLRRVALRKTREEVAPELPKKAFAYRYPSVDNKVLKECAGVDKEELARYVKSRKGIPAHIATLVKAVGLSKVKDICEWANDQDLDKPIIIFAWHREVIAKLKKGLKGKRVAVLTGDTKPFQRIKLQEAYQKGKIQRFIVQMRAGGISIDLDYGNVCAFAEIPWSPEYFTQSIGRMIRMTSTGKRILAYIFKATETTDTIVWDSMSSALQDTEEILRGR